MRHRRLRRARRVIAGGILAVAAAALLAASGAAAPVEPALQREPLPGDAEVTYAVVDPLQVAIDAAVAGAGSAACFRDGVSIGGCQAGISELVRQRGAALGVTANYSDGVHILGLAVIDHVQYAPANAHTTSLCAGDAPGPGVRPPLSITKDADPTRCRTAVSGERLVAGGVPDIEGLADDGLSGHFWWSVQHVRRVERTLVGLRPDGTLVVAVATSMRSGVRNGMTLAEAAAWLIAHGAIDAIALDGGHQADILSAQHGSQVPLERGEPALQIALLLGAVGPVATSMPAASPPAAVEAGVARAHAPLAGGRLAGAALRVDGLVLQGVAAAATLDVPVGAPALPDTGVTGSGAGHLRSSIAGDPPVQLDARWLAAAHSGHRLADLDLPPAAAALPETGVVHPAG